MFSLVSSNCYPAGSGSIEEMNLGPLRVDRIDVIKAIAHFQNDYPQKWQRVSDEYSLHSDERAVDYIQKQLLEGCCSGIVNALFDKIIRGECRSIEEASHDLQPEDVFYAQTFEDFRGHMFNFHYGENQCSVEEGIEKRKFHGSHFIESQSFNPNSSAICHQQVLEQAVVEKLQCDKTEDIVGMAPLGVHVFAFQYGPQGYFLLNPSRRATKLYKCSNSDAFFMQLAHLTNCYCQDLERKITRYSVRPLNHINPLLPPLQNASEAKEEEAAAS